jgi:hypothetical protein
LETAPDDDVAGFAARASERHRRLDVVVIDLDVAEVVVAMSGAGRQ